MYIGADVSVHCAAENILRIGMFRDFYDELMVVFELLSVCFGFSFVFSGSLGHKYGCKSLHCHKLSISYQATLIIEVS